MIHVSNHCVYIHFALKARQKRKEQEEAAKLKKQQEAEEKKQRAKALRNASKAKESSRRHQRLGTIMGNLIHCRFCDQMIDQMEFDEHKVSHPTHIRQRIWLGNAENSKDLSFIKKYGTYDGTNGPSIHPQMYTQTHRHYTHFKLYARDQFTIEYQ